MWLSRWVRTTILTKPFEREQLMFLVSRVLEYSRRKLESLTYQTNLESLVKARTEQLQAAMSSLERSYDMTGEGFGDALALKNAETEGHSKRSLSSPSLLLGP